MTFVEKFLIIFVFTTMINTAGWQKYVTANLYDCSDENFPGYWQPGLWVHSHDGHSIWNVPQIIHDRSMGDADTIKEGWTIGRLLGLWFSFFSISLVASLMIARLPWTRREWSNRALDRTAGRSVERF